MPTPIQTDATVMTSSNAPTASPPGSVAPDQQPARLLRRVAPAVGLLLLAPLVGEYLLGNVSIVEIAALPILALLYGSGAVLIRRWRAAPGVAGRPSSRSAWPMA
jgi:hypothetical protein